MQDSDDLYFGNDDFVVDEATIAALDEVERTYTSSTQVQRPLQTSGSPPSKRVKLNNDRPAQSKKRKRNSKVFEESPDVFVEDEGMYNVTGDTQSRVSTALVTRGSDVQQSVPNSSSYRKPVSHPARTVNVRESVAGPSKPRQEAISRHASGPVFGSQRANTPAAPSAPTKTAAKSRAQRAQPKSAAEAEIASLKRRIEMLNAQLEDSKTEVIVKEGEVAVLRASMQKTAEEHESELVKLEIAKNQAEAARLQLQKEHQEELERLKTIYVFKQYEVETSVRRPPWSAKKGVKHMNITPMKVPAEIRAWNSGVHDDAGPIAETPRRLHFSSIGTPTGPHQPVAPTQGASKAVNLPGFFNSFTQASPTRSLSQRTKHKDSESGRARDEDVFIAPPSPPSSPTRYGMRIAELPDVPMEDVMPPPPLNEAEYPAMRSSPIDQDEDVMMSAPPSAPPVQTGPTIEIIREVQPPDWTDTLHRLLFGHTMPSTKTPTLHLILNSPLPSSAPAEDLQAYSSACGRLLENVATGSSFSESARYLRTVLKTLSDMAELLVAHGSISTLTALFHMLQAMSYIIPSFAEALLAPLPGESEGTPAKIVTTMRDAISCYVAVNDGAKRDTRTAVLASETVSLLEALSWKIPENVVPRLCPFIRAPMVMMSLLGPKQPAALVRDTARMLSVLATHPNFFRQLLAHPYPEAGQEQAEDVRSIQHLDQLYSYLADSAKEVDLKDSILAFITTAALAHADAVMILLQSYILIPSIISYLTDVTNPLWEEDLDLMTSQTEIDWVIQMTNRLVALLSYLVFSSPTTYNLRYRLHHLPHRRFNGIAHMFTVTMSRLSFADPPHWLTEVQKVQLEQTMDMATKLLELVVDGPELEVAWIVFQTDTESKPETEEEREARLLHPEDTD